MATPFYRKPRYADCAHYYGRYVHKIVDKLKIEESPLIGQWIILEGQVIGDEACKRIEWAIENELEEVCSDASGWETVYRNFDQSQYWLLSYPQSELQGGGPPKLESIGTNEVKKICAAAGT